VISGWTIALLIVAGGVDRPERSASVGRMVRAALAAALVALAAAPLVAQDAEIDSLTGSDKLAAVLKRVASEQAAIRTLQADSSSAASAGCSPSRRCRRDGSTSSPRPGALGVPGAAPDDGDDRGRLRRHLPPEEQRAERVAIGRMQRRIFHYMSVTEPLDELKDHFSFTFHDRSASRGTTVWSSSRPTRSSPAGSAS